MFFRLTIFVLACGFSAGYGMQGQNPDPTNPEGDARYMLGRISPGALNINPNLAESARNTQRAITAAEERREFEDNAKIFAEAVNRNRKRRHSISDFRPR